MNAAMENVIQIQVRLNADELTRLTELMRLTSMSRSDVRRALD